MFRILISALLLAPLSVKALDFSFYGREPPRDPGGNVQIQAGVNPGIPVVFQVISPNHMILRPARSDEQSNKLRPVYLFEWLADKSARFYELADPEEIKSLFRQNEADTATAEGKAYELKAIQRFFDGGKVLQGCLPPQKPYRGSITAYFVVTEMGGRDRAVVLPEGSVSECITEAASKAGYPVPTHRFTAKAEINVTK